MLRTISDPPSGYVLKRFATELAIIITCALAQLRTPWGFGRALAILAVFSSLSSMVLAVSYREHPTTRALNYWDEAVGFLAIGIVAHWLT